MTTHLTKQMALEIAETTAAGQCSVSDHTGDRNQHAIRISGCTINDAQRIGREIADALPGGAYRDGGDIHLVWYEMGTDMEDWRRRRAETDAEELAYLEARDRAMSGE